MLFSLSWLSHLDHWGYLLHVSMGKWCRQNNSLLYYNGAAYLWVISSKEFLVTHRRLSWKYWFRCCAVAILWNDLELGNLTEIDKKEENVNNHHTLTFERNESEGFCLPGVRKRLVNLPLLGWMLDGDNGLHSSSSLYSSANCLGCGVYIVEWIAVPVG